MMNVISNSPSETFMYGENLVSQVKNGFKIFLIGDLGAGKTQFVKGLAKGLGIHDIIQSPTYTLMKTYKNSNGISLYHFDYYRLHGNEGIDIEHTQNIVEQKDGIFVFEWADRLEIPFMKPDITVFFQHVSFDQRRIDIMFL